MIGTKSIGTIAHSMIGTIAHRQRDHCQNGGNSHTAQSTSLQYVCLKASVNMLREQYIICGSVFQCHGIMLHKMFSFNTRKTAAADERMRNFVAMTSLKIFLLFGVVFGPTIIRGKPHHIDTSVLCGKV